MSTSTSLVRTKSGRMVPPRARRGGVMTTGWQPTGWGNLHLPDHVPTAGRAREVWTCICGTTLIQPPNTPISRFLDRVADHARECQEEK